MIPKTRIQKEVFKLSKDLHPITEAQKRYAYNHCFKHIGRKTAKGIVTCTECGHSWSDKSSSYITTCPHCSAKLKVVNTRKRVSSETEYFSIITRVKQYQVIRFFLVKLTRKVGHKAQYTISEVVQQWINKDGQFEIMAKYRNLSSYYYDLWLEGSKLEIRRNKDHKAYAIEPAATYPKEYIIPEIIRNGYDGHKYGMSPQDLFLAILADNKKESLLKMGYGKLLKHFIYSAKDMNAYWSAIKICSRNKYEINEPSIWCDYIDLLIHYNKDIKNAKYVCPEDLNMEHDILVKKKTKDMNKLRMEADKKKALEHEQTYYEQKHQFFNLRFTDGMISIRVLQSVQDFINEAEYMKHCVFTNEYYLEKESLILTASIENQKLETIEFSLESFKVLQCHGRFNKNSEYHEQILSLINKNIPQIIRCKNAQAA